MNSSMGTLSHATFRVVLPQKESKEEEEEQKKAGEGERNTWNRSSFLSTKPPLQKREIPSLFIR
jgi:hypothetical protein